MRKLASSLVRLLSHVVPSATRREFRDEWEAELESDWRSAGSPSLRRRLHLAARAFGAVPDAWYLIRQQWSLSMLTQELRHAWRVLARRPAYTLIVTSTLAVGIGATTAMVSALDAVLMRPLPYPAASRLMVVWENDRVNAKPRYPVAPANWNDWRTGNRTFEGLSAWINSGGSLSLDGDPFHVQVPVVSTELFDTLTIAPALGRGFEPGDAVPPRHRVLILSHDTWRTRFNGDPGVIDRTVKYNDVPYRIVGVMPSGFAFPTQDAAAWRPLAITPDLLQTRAQHYLTLIGRLKAGVSAQQAHADLETIAEGAAEAWPATNDQRGTTIVALREALTGDVRRPMLLLTAAVALLLLIGVVNVANLMLVEATARRREMAVRTALGADRLRIVRQLCAEALLLVAMGSSLGFLLAVGALDALVPIAAQYVPRLDQIAVDARVFGFAAVVSLVTGIGFGLVPAIVTAHSDVQRDLRQSARGSIGGSSRLRSTLVVLEFTAAVVLLVGAALVMRSFWNVLHVDPGFNGRVLTASLELPARYDKDAMITQFYADVLTRVRGVPGVHAAGVVNNLPVSGSAWTSWLTIENAPPITGEPPEVGYRTASPGYFEALQIPLLRGRTVTQADVAGALPVVVINRALAERFFPAADAIGRRIRLGPNPKDPWWTIVGIVGNTRHHGLEAEPTPEAFLPNAQEINGDMAIALRGDGDVSALAATLRSAVRAADPSVTVWRIRTLDAMLAEDVAPRRLSMLVIQSFAAVALSLALIGIYGVLSYSVSQRQPEFGVRMALGASPRQILRSTLRDGVRLALPGLLLGTAIALVVTRLAQTVLFNVSPADPLVYAAVLTLALAVALAASLLPARRAARVDPLSAIRNE